MSTERWKVMKAFEKYGHQIEYRERNTSLRNGDEWRACDHDDGPLWSWARYQYRVMAETVPEVRVVYFVDGLGTIVMTQAGSDKYGAFATDRYWTEVELCK